MQRAARAVPLNLLDCFSATRQPEVLPDVGENVVGSKVMESFVESHDDLLRKRMVSWKQHRMSSVIGKLCTTNPATKAEEAIRI